MSQEDTEKDLQLLGEYLCEQRQQKGASLADVSEATRISLPVLEAIEDDAHERMPAEAFCRGFYTMYANFLGLDPQEILNRYQDQLGPRQKKDAHLSNPPVKKSQSAANYAEPSAVSPGTSMTLLLLAGFAIFVAICWYLNCNPVDYLSSKLMPSPPVIGQEQPEDSQQAAAATDIKEQPAGVILEDQDSSPSPKAPPAAQPDIPQVDPATTLSPAAPEKQDETVPALAASPYQLEIHFLSSSTLKVTLDDGFVLEKHFNAGETQLWEAENKIVLDMPESSKGNLRLNGIAIPLPEAHDGRRRLSLPEDLLDIN